MARILEWFAIPSSSGHFVLILHASKVMFKILQARLQHYMKWELPDVQNGFRKSRGRKILCFCFIDNKKIYDFVDHNRLWNILKEMGIPDHLTCLLRNLYTGQEETVKTLHGRTDWFKIGKGVRQGSILSPCLFNLNAEYIMWNAGLDELQVGIKVARINISNIR